MAEWRRSGLSQREFCREHDLSFSSFRYWRNRLSDRGELKDTGLVRIVPAELVETGASVKIHIADHVVETDGRIEPDRLTAILRAVRDL